MSRPSSASDLFSSFFAEVSRQQTYRTAVNPSPSARIIWRCTCLVTYFGLCLYVQYHLLHTVRLFLGSRVHPVEPGAVHSRVVGSRPSSPLWTGEKQKDDAAPTLASIGTYIRSTDIRLAVFLRSRKVLVLVFTPAYDTGRRWETAQHLFLPYHHHHLTARREI